MNELVTNLERAAKAYERAYGFGLTDQIPTTREALIKARSEPSDGTILTPDVLRQHADKAMNPHWEDEARQLLKWAADLIYAAELLRLDMNKTP